MLLRTWDADYTAIRERYASVVDKVWDFDSAKKTASVLIRTSDGYRLYNKASLMAHTALCSLLHMCLTSHKCSAADCLDCWVVARLITVVHDMVEHSWYKY